MMRRASILEILSFPLKQGIRFLLDGILIPEVGVYSFIVQVHHPVAVAVIFLANEEYSLQQEARNASECS